MTEVASTFGVGLSGGAWRLAMVHGVTGLLTSPVPADLPGSVHYNPALPRIQKVWDDGLAAAGMVAFFDDGRVFGPTRPLVSSALHQVTLQIQARGNQDAARKRREISLRPGACWAGCIAYMDHRLVRRFTSQEKWDKAKRQEMIDGPMRVIYSDRRQMLETFLCFSQAL